MRRLSYLYAAAFLMMFGLGCQIAGVPLVAKRAFGANVWQLAALGLVGSVGYTVFCFGMGVLVGRARPLNVSIAGAVLYGAAMTAAVKAQTLWQLAIAIAVGSLGHALFWPMLEAAIAAGARGRALSRRMGAFNIAWSLGDVFGIIIAGRLYDIDRRLPFLMIGVSAVLMVAALVRAKSARVVRNGTGTAAEAAADMLEVAPGVNLRFTRAAWVGNFVSSGVMQVIRSVFADAATDIFRMSGTVYGLAIGTVNVCRTLTFVLFRLWRDWHYRAGIYLACAGLLTAGLAGLVVAAFLPHAAGVALVFASFAAVGLSIGTTYYASIFYSVHSEAAAESKTRLHEAVIGAGGAAAIFASGASSRLVEAASASLGGLAALAPLTPFMFCGAAAAAGVVISGLLILGRRPVGGCGNGGNPLS